MTVKRVELVGEGRRWAESKSGMLMSEGPSGHKLPTNVRLAGGNMEGIANLVVGAVNLGVGLYNAYQLSKVRSDLSSMRNYLSASLGGMERVLQQHSEILGRLAVGQGQLAHALDQLRVEMTVGFLAVHDHLESQQVLEFRKLHHTLLLHYRPCSDAIADGLAPSPPDLMRVVTAAGELRGWVRAQRDLLAPGDARRLPLLVSEAVAVRIDAEARALETPDRGLDRRRQRELADEVAKEAAALCSGKTLYEIGVTFSPLLLDYAVLHQALTTGGKLDEIDGQLAQVLEAPLGIPDDGLGELRSMLQVEGEAPLRRDDLLALKTIEDYEWLIRFRGLDRSTLDVHAWPSVRVDVLLDALGLPSDRYLPAGEQSVELLRRLAEPAVRDRVVRMLAEVFGWSEPPELASASTVDLPSQVGSELRPPSMVAGWATLPPWLQRQVLVDDGLSLSWDRWRLRFWVEGEQLLAEHCVDDLLVRYTVQVEAGSEPRLSCLDPHPSAHARFDVPRRFVVQVPQKATWGWALNVDLGGRVDCFTALALPTGPTTPAAAGEELSPPRPSRAAHAHWRSMCGSCGNWEYVRGGKPASRNCSKCRRELRDWVPV